MLLEAYENLMLLLLFSLMVLFCYTQIFVLVLLYLKCCKLP